MSDLSLGASDDREATSITPTAEGVRRAQLASGLADIFDSGAAARPGVDAENASSGRFAKLLEAFHVGGGLPAIVAGAAPLLALADALRETPDEPDMAALQTMTVAAVRDYERDLAGARVAPERARAAHYVLCAMIDDIVLSKPWGVRGGWSQSGLVSTFHMDVTGGDRVFDLLDHFHRNPGANKDLLLLIYLCLSLGFEGRTRVSPRGTLELMQIRDGLYRTLRGQFGDFERELSPHWRGISARHRPLRNAAALWALLGALLLFFALGYLLFTLALNGASDVTLSRFAAAVPEAVPSLAAIERPKPPATPVEETAVAAEVPPPAETPAPPVVEKPDPLDTFAAFLQPEVEQNLVTLSRKDNAVLVRIRNAGLFETGSAEVSGNLRELLNRIGTAMAAESFKGVVIGHTDDVPIRTAQYPSNWHLSEARAKAVADILMAASGPGTVTSEGRAETEPVADNATPEGREANRRTEILVLGVAGQERARSEPQTAGPEAEAPAPAGETQP